jgi:hypothetical protein
LAPKFSSDPAIQLPSRVVVAKRDKGNACAILDHMQFAISLRNSRHS